MPVLTAQFMYLTGGCQYAAARHVAEDLLRLGEAPDDVLSRLLGTRSMAAVRHWVGEFVPAAKYWEETLGLYAPEAHGSLASSAGLDVRTQALILSAWDLLILGHLDQARSRATQALDWTRHLNHYHSLAFGLVHLGIFYSLLRAEGSALATSEAATAVATEQRLAHWVARANVVRGHALAVRGDAAAGLALVRNGFAECRSTMYTITGSFINETYYVSVLARTCEMAGLADEARSLFANALENAKRTGEGWFEAELYRLLGEWHRAHRRDGSAGAEAAFRSAIAVAQRQGAKLWELRAAVSLSRLCGDQGREAEGRDLLAPICAWFTEGFDTPDLREATALLNELSDRSGSMGTRRSPPTISQ
jgi:predicted ATPase